MKLLNRPRYLTAAAVCSCLQLAHSWAATASAEATASATIVSPATVAADAAAQLLFGSAPGVLTLSIPGSGSAGSGSGGADATGTPVFTYTGSGGSGPGLTQLAELALGDGTLAGGQGVSLALSGSEGDTVVAIVAYN